MPETNPYAEFETAPPANSSAPKAGGNPYAEFETIKPPAAVVTKQPAESHWYTGVGDTLLREGKAGVQSLIQMPKAIAQGAYEDVKGGHVPLIHSMIAEPVKTAVNYYIDYAKADPEKRNRMQSDMLSVAPEAMGLAGGMVVGGKLIEGAGRVVKGGNPMEGPLEPGEARPVSQTRAEIAKQEFGPKTVDIAKAAPGAVADAAGAVKDKVVDVAARGVEHGKNIASRASTPKNLATIATTTALPGWGHAVGPAVGKGMEILMGKERANTPFYKPSAEVAEPLDATGENKPFAGESAKGRSFPAGGNAPEKTIATPVKNLGEENVKPNIAEPASEQPNIGKRVGIRDESKAARAMQEDEPKPTEPTPGPVGPQTVGPAEEKLNKLAEEPIVRPGVKMKDQTLEPVKAPEGPKLSSRPDKAIHQTAGANEAEQDALHSITNAELGELASRAGYDMGTRTVGRAKGKSAAEQVSRADVFSALYKLGLKPADILKLRK